MSDLIAIAYPDQATAERVRGRLAEGEGGPAPGPLPGSGAWRVW